MPARMSLAGLGLAATLLWAGAAAGETVPGQTQSQPPVYLRLATGTVAGTYFPVGQAMGRLLSRPADAGPCETGESCGVEGLTLVPMASEGTLANLQLVASGIADMALVQADLAEDAFKGRGLFSETGAFGNLRAIARLNIEAVHLVVDKASKITRVSDLKGRRVAVGAPGSGINAEARAVLRAYGVRADSIKMLEIGGRDAADGLAQGEIDAMFFVGGLPVALVSSLNQTENIRLVPIAGPGVKALLKRHTAMTTVTIPDSAYPGLGPVDTVGVPTLWVTTDALDGALVERLCQTFWNVDTQKRLGAVHPSVAGMTLRLARATGALPLHDGARRCYDALGVPEDVTPAAPGDAPPMPRMRPAIPASPVAG